MTRGGAILDWLAERCSQAGSSLLNGTIEAWVIANNSHLFFEGRACRKFFGSSRLAPGMTASVSFIADDQIFLRGWHERRRSRLTCRHRFAWVVGGLDSWIEVAAVFLSETRLAGRGMARIFGMAQCDEAIAGRTGKQERKRRQNKV